ncbi:MerR family transcriptional regulator [Rubrivirga sp. IMCC43871]|uniref:MerR family transcriptional regulator n=1 Tax=Rubrivirga sp. IMCC43871 TaxID=3391575 RepID=UPI00399025F5
MTDTLSVGALAARAGVTVRTLHHYDAIGLVRARRSEAGHRRYGPADVERLHHVTALRTLGLGLDAIAEALDAPDFDARAVVARQRAAFDAEAGRLRALADRLAGLDRLLAQRAETGAAVDSDTFLSLTRLMNDLQAHYTPDQLRKLADRRESFGEDAIRDVEAEWPRLFEAVGAAMDAGTDPADPAVQELVERWDDLVALFTGGDPGIRQSLGTAVEANPSGASQMMGLAPERMKALFAYAQRAREAR